MNYKCSYCSEPAQFYLKISNKIKPLCMNHYHKIKTRRLKMKLLKEGIKYEKRESD